MNTLTTLAAISGESLVQTVAAMTDQEMTRVMVRVVIVCLVAGGCFLLIDWAFPATSNPPINKFGKVIIAVLAMLYLLNTLMRLGW